MKGENNTSSGLGMWKIMHITGVHNILFQLAFMAIRNGMREMTSSAGSCKPLHI